MLCIISKPFLPTSCTSFIRLSTDFINVLQTKSDTCNQEIICVDHVAHMFVEMSFSLRFAIIYIFFFVHFILVCHSAHLGCWCRLANRPRLTEYLFGIIGFRSRSRIDFKLFFIVFLSFIHKYAGNFSRFQVTLILFNFPPWIRKIIKKDTLVS